MQGAIATLVMAIAGNGLTLLVFGTVAFSLLMSVLFLLTRGSDSMYDQIGAGGMSRESDYDGGSAAPSEGAAAEQEQEVRQMLQARSERGVMRGEAPLDVDAEVARLLAPAGGPAGQDPALEAEVRQMVLARNERRARQGQEPLDVDSEVSRTLAELNP